MQVPPVPRTPGGARRFLDAYTQGLSATELERLFTFFLAFTLKLTPARRAIYALARATGGYERLRDGGVALGMFEHATYSAGRVELRPGDVLVMYSDGITEAEDPHGRPFDEAGPQHVVDAAGWGSAKELGWATFAAVERHAQQRRLLDDLTVLVARRLPPLPVIPMAEQAAVGV